MGTGYNRNDTANNIADGNIINASDLDGEFDAIDAAFDETTGHTHDGTSGEGGAILTVGPAQDLVTSIAATYPKSNNVLDLGTVSNRFKDFYLAGNALVGGTLGVTGVTTFTAQPVLSSLTASRAVFTDGSKGLVSNALTGTGNVVMSASPTLTGTAGFENITASGTLGVTGNTTLVGQLIGDNDTDSTSISTGAFQTDGGLGVTKALWVGGLANVAGAVTLQSTLGVTGTTTLSGAAIATNSFTLRNTSTDILPSAVVGELTFDSLDTQRSGTDVGSISIVSEAGFNGTTDDKTSLLLKTFNGTSLATAVTITGAGNMTVAGTTTVTGAFAANGGATLGDASGDALTINSSAVSIPNGLNFDSNTLVIDATNNRVGVGAVSPSTSFQVYQASSGEYMRVGTNDPARSLVFSSFTSGLTGVGHNLNAVSSSGVITLSTNSTERMRIDSSGNVMIGAATPLNAATGRGYLLVNGASNSVIDFGVDGSSVGYLYHTGTDLRVFNGEAGALQFYTNATERMRISDTGNVGIGVTPSAWNSVWKVMQVGAGASLFASNDGTLNVLSANMYSDATNLATPKYIGTGAAAQYRQSVGNHIWYTAPSGTAGNPITFTQAMILEPDGDLTTSGNIYYGGRLLAAAGGSGDGTAAYPGICVGLDYDNGFFRPSSNVIGISTAGTERMRITDAGEVLIGTTLDINSNRFQVAQSDQTLATFTNTSGAYVQRFLKSRSATVGTNTIVQNGDTIGGLLFQGADGTGYREAASILAGVGGVPGANDMPGFLSFRTTADGASSATERVRITADGYLRLTSSALGIQFNGNTAAANALDDYEEGTWTPTLSSSGTAPTVSSYANRTGSYTKIGNLVTVTCYIRATITAAGTGTPRITGMPFTAAGFLDGVARGLTNLFTTQPSGMYVTSSIVIAENAVYITGSSNYITFTVSYRVA
jgi:hypothetical protein